MYISKEKKQKISEQILAFLYSISPQPTFTYYIAREIARDEEFIKKLLKELKAKRLVVEVNKNPQGKNYLRRSRWKLTDEAYLSYKKNQPSNF
ncbi:MAG: hypothetical protein AABW63_02865 [Nanoarchaeota archaeon]